MFLKKTEILKTAIVGCLVGLGIFNAGIGLAEPTDLNKVLNINQPTEEDRRVAERASAAQKAAEQRRNEALQHFDAARVYLGGGNTELAELELQAAIWKDAGIRAFHRDYCLVAILRGQPIRAFAEAMVVFGLGDPIQLSEKQESQLQDEGCKLHYRRGIAMAKVAKWTDAVSEYQWALLYRPDTSKVLRSMAFANASQGKIELAEKQYESSFTGAPGDAYGHADCAYLLADSGNAAGALKQLQEAVKLQPKVAALHIDLGWMAESKGDLSEAESEFATAAELSPNHAALWAHLGKILTSEGKLEKAAEAYHKATAIDPTVSQTL